MNKKYEQLWQLEDIADSANHGNFSVAATECVEYGFHASSFQKFSEEIEYLFADGWEDIVILVEMATKLRHERTRS